MHVHEIVDRLNDENTDCEIVELLKSEIERSYNKILPISLIVNSSNCQVAMDSLRRKAGQEEMGQPEGARGRIGRVA